MATMTIKNIPDEIYDSFKELAGKNRRSINNEAIYWLEQAISRQRYKPEEIIRDARMVRETLGVYMTQADIDEAIDEGRP